MLLFASVVVVIAVVVNVVFVAAAVVVVVSLIKNEINYSIHSQNWDLKWWNLALRTEYNWCDIIFVILSIGKLNVYINISSS